MFHYSHILLNKFMISTFCAWCERYIFIIPRVQCFINLSRVVLVSTTNLQFLVLPQCEVLRSITYFRKYLALHLCCIAQQTKQISFLKVCKIFLSHSKHRVCIWYVIKDNLSEWTLIILTHQQWLITVQMFTLDMLNEQKLDYFVDLKAKQEFLKFIIQFWGILYNCDCTSLNHQPSKLKNCWSS